jgi:hypothetical protein
MGIFPLKPTDIKKPGSWFYQERKGLCVVAELRDKDSGYLGTTVTDIPWRKLVPAFKNYQRMKRAATRTK